MRLLRGAVGIAAFLSLAFHSTPSIAQNISELRWTHFGLRPLGMGNAYVAVADDYNALFYNPAGLARLKEWDGEFLNPAFEISQSTLDLVGDVQKLLEGSSGDTDAALELLNGLVGKTFHGSFSWTPHLIFKHFGLGIGAELRAQSVVHREIAVDLRFGPTIIAPVSMAFNCLGDKLSVGATAKFIVVGGIDKELSIENLKSISGGEGDDSTTAEGDETGSNESLDDYVIGGFATGADIGILFTPFETWEPTLGLSIIDIGGTPFTEFNVSGSATAAPNTRLPAVNTGISIKPLKSASQYLLVSMDAHAINQPIHYSKKLNMGVEWGFRQLLKLQAGLHQGELSGGMQFDVGLLNFRLATYAEQLSPIAGQHDKLRSRRYAAQFKLLL